MKKITLFLFALISGTAFAQSSASGTADVFAEIVSPISISQTNQSLNFGNINSISGQVTVKTDDSRTSSVSGMLIASNDVHAASFEVTAADQYPYVITIDDTFLTGPGANMALTFTDSYAEAGTTPTGNGAAQTLKVGGTLTVNAGQAAGSYDGTVTVTVAYE